MHRALKAIETAKKKSLSSITSINVEDCGAAFRFLLPVLAASPGEWLLTGTKRLLQRPILPLVHFLSENGAAITLLDKGLHITGKEIHIKKGRLSCQQSSQFASALLLAQPLLHFENAEIFLEKKEELYPYIELTKKIIADVQQKQESYLNERDWSAAVYWYSYTLLKKEPNILLEHLSLQSIQNDRNIALFYEKLGVLTTETKKGIFLNYKETKKTFCTTLDLSKHIDLAPVIAVTSLLFPFELTLEGIENLKYKESNRWQHLIDTLSRFTRVEILSSYSFKIHKREKNLPEIIKLNSHNDHRLVMAWHLFSIFSEIEITNCEAINKSYPNFFRET